MQSTRKRVIYLLVASMLTAGIIIYLYNRFEPVQIKPTPPAMVPMPGVLRFPTGAPQLDSLRINVAEELPVPLAEPLNGRVTYNENVTARVSSPVAGRVVAMKAQPGDRVAAGDTLMILDSPEYALAVSDLRKGEADQVRKKAAFERAKSLYEGQVLARKDLESAEADLVQARAETVRAQVRLRNLRADPSDAGQFALRAPLPGTIVERQANPGMEVRPDLPSPLFIVTNVKLLWVLIDLPERDLGKVVVGRSADVEVDAYPGERFSAVIERVGVTVDAATRRVQVRCAVANPDLRLKPEMYARVTLVADEKIKAVRLPNASLVTEGLNSYVFVETEPGVFAKRRVELSVRDREYSYVASGVKSGERVVTTGALLLSSELAAGG